MPYTFAHPGFSLWIEKYLPGTPAGALVAGSLVPDADILFRWRESRFHLFGSSVDDVLLFMLPLGLLLFWYFARWAGPVYRQVLPPVLFERWPEAQSPDQLLRKPWGAAGILLGVLAGIALHLGLDAISHWDPVLCMYLADYFFSDHPVFLEASYYTAWYLPQIIATALGFYLLYKYTLSDITTDRFWTEWRDLPIGARRFWFGFGVVAILFATVKFALFGFEGYFGVHYGIIYLTGGLAAAALILPLLYLLFQNRPHYP